MNKTIKLDYEEFKELERKAKEYDDGRILISIEEITAYFRYGYNYTIAVTSSKEELSKYIEDKVKEVINLDEGIKNIKKSLEEEKVKEVDEITGQQYKRISALKTELDTVTKNGDNFVKVQKNPLYKILHFLRLM